MSMNVGMPTPSYLIAVGDLSLQDRVNLRSSADEDLLNAALRLKIKDVAADLVLRDTLPGTDLAIGTAANDTWLIAGVGVAGTELQYFAPTIGINQCVAFWGVGSPMASPNISRIRFTIGLASVTTKGEFQIEPLQTRLEPTGYFSTPIIYLRQDVARVMVLPKTAFAASTEQLHLGSRLIEPLGVTVSAPIA